MIRKLLSALVISSLAVSVMAQGQTRTYPRPNNVVTVLHMNEESGSVAYDSIGTNHFTVTGATRVRGRFGLGYYFAGTGSGNNLAITSNATLQPANVSISIWFRTRGGAATGIAGCLISAKKTTVASWMLEYNIFDIGAGGNIGFTIVNGAGTPVSCQTPTSVFDMKWHKIKGTKDPTGVRLFLDGRRVARTLSTQALDYTGASTVYIGTYDNSSTFIGTLDEAVFKNTGDTSEATEESEFLDGLLTHNPEVYVRILIAGRGAWSGYPTNSIQL